MHAVLVLPFEDNCGVLTSVGMPFHASLVFDHDLVTTDMKSFGINTTEVGLSS